MAMPDLDRIRASLPAHYAHCVRLTRQGNMSAGCDCTATADITALLDIAEQVDPNRDLP